METKNYCIEYYGLKRKSHTCLSYIFFSQNKYIINRSMGFDLQNPKSGHQNFDPHGEISKIF